jgi:hypothetical protein
MQQWGASSPIIHDLQMGGAKGVRAAEIGNLTLQLRGGLHMHCVPRATLE